MKTKTLQALKESIAHWKRMATGKREDEEEPTSRDCALCQLFFMDGCIGCPVAKRTGNEECVGSPYEDAREAMDEHGIDTPEFQDKARRELSFLKSLLPRKRKMSNI